MPWTYAPIPASLRLPACERCGNRLKVVMVLRCVFHCGDCGHAFAATWQADARPAVADGPGLERTA